MGDEKMYTQLLDGERRGKIYQDNYYYIKQEKRSVKDISKSEISPPTNINPETTIKNENMRKKATLRGKKGGSSVDPKVLEKLLKRK